MTPGWGRKRCSRRLFPPPLCVPVPRPCLDSLQIPTLYPCALHRPLRNEFVPRCVQPPCGIKHPICHCADRNYCTAETCTNSRNCRKSQNFFCPYGIKGDKDEDSVCNGPCRQHEDGEKNDIEDYNKDEPSCNEASCERLKNCGVGSTSNDEELIHPVTYTPSTTNQNGMQPIVSNKQKPINSSNTLETNHINNSSLSVVGFTGKKTTPKSNHFSEVIKLSNNNRCIQINMQNETISRKRRDRESLVAPEVCCSGNEVPNCNSLSGSSERNSSNGVNKSVPTPNIKSTFDTATERYNTNEQKYIQSSKTSQFQLNTNLANADDNDAKSSNNIISSTEENNNNLKKSGLNLCCKYSYDLPTSSDPKYQEELNYPGNEKSGDDFQGFRELYQQNDKLSSKQYENRAQINLINGAPMQSVPQRSPGINIDRPWIQDNSQDILSRKNILSNDIPSSKLSLSRTTLHDNESTTNELVKRTLTGNNSTNTRRLLNESENNVMSITPNDCCISGGTQGHLDFYESTTSKSPQFMSSSVDNIQPIRSYTKHPLMSNTSKQISGSQLNQVRFHDNDHINNATSSSPSEKQNLKYNSVPRSSRMKINDDNNNKIQTANSDVFDQKDSVICEGCVHGCCTHGSNETANKREIPIQKPTPDLNYVSPDAVTFFPESKHKQKSTPKFESTHDLKDIRCEKKQTCVIEDGMSSCASTTCVVNQNLGCNCRYPPAFKFSCTGNISGICNCNEKE